MQYCEVTLTEEKYQAFVYAVKNHYWYQMYIDDLPIWGKCTKRQIQPMSNVDQFVIYRLE